MKNIYYIFILIFLATTYSCSEDYIDQKSPDKLTSDNFWRNLEDAEAGLSAAYSQIESSSDYWGGFQEGRQVLKQYRSDYVDLGADANNYASWTDVYNFTYTYGNPNLFYFWQINYKGLNFTNQVIAKVGAMGEDKISTTERDEIVAEAKFLRAYYHLELLQYFTDIIVRDEIINDETIEKGVSPRAEVYQIIIKDLEDAIANMKPEHNNLNKGRATSYTAMAYLGKAYLYRAGEEPANAATYFQNAADALAPIVTDGNYSLVSDYISMWNGTASNSSESLFELQMTQNEDNGAYYKFALYYFYGANEFGGWEEIVGTDALVSEMKSEGQIASDGNYDARLYWNCYFDDPYFNDPATNEVYGQTFEDWFGPGNTKVYFRKYIPPAAEDFDTWGLALNIPLMRYADVLLMYAEALNETGNPSLAATEINKVRTRAKMPNLSITSQADIRAQIKHERVMELTLEGNRFFDLLRWGDIEDAMQKAGRTNFKLSEHSYLPIPESEVNSNSAL